MISGSCFMFLVSLLHCSAVIDLKSQAKYMYQINRRLLLYYLMWPVSYIYIVMAYNVKLAGL